VSGAAEKETPPADATADETDMSRGVEERCALPRGDEDESRGVTERKKTLFTEGDFFRFLRLAEVRLLGVRSLLLLFSEVLLFSLAPASWPFSLSLLDLSGADELDVVEEEEEDRGLVSPEGGFDAFEEVTPPKRTAFPVAFFSFEGVSSN